MIEIKYISQSSLQQWLSKIKGEGQKIYAPVKKDKVTQFKMIDSIDELSLNHIQTTTSAKEIAFPRVEKLFSYSKTKGDVELTDFEAEAIPHSIVFGLHPCDVKGFKSLSGIFNWDTKDVPFNEHMKRTTFIGMGCVKADEYCFCTSVGGSSGDTDGSDILLTPAEDGYIVEILTEKGKELVDKHANLFEADKNLNKEDYLVKISARFTREEINQKLVSMFENDVWKQQAERCLGCGACAFVCPTCACFDIQEDAKGAQGSRLRCWDSCGFSLFTMHTSGHNPREMQSQRWRQRLLHKFSYMPERLSVYGCTGCGRCSRACPVDMNIAEHLEEIAKL